MASSAVKRLRSPSPTAHEGIYIRSMPMVKMQKIARRLWEAFSALPDDADGEAASEMFQRQAWQVFDRVLCDENGDRLPDYPNEDDCLKMDAVEANSYIQAFNDFFASLKPKS